MGVIDQLITVGGAHCNYLEAVSSIINQVTDVSPILFPLKAIICRMSLIDFPSQEKHVIIHQHINNVRNKQTWHCPLNVTVIWLWVKTLVPFRSPLSNWALWMFILPNAINNP